MVWDFQEMASYIFEDDEDYGDNDDIQQMNVML